MSGEIAPYASKIITLIEEARQNAFDLKGVTAESLNEWLEYFFEQLKEREVV